MAATFVQTRSAALAADPSTLAFTSNVLADSVLVVVLLHANATVTVSSVTDSLGNTWQRLGSRYNNTYGRDVFWVLNTGGAGACTVTFDFSGTPTITMATLWEFSGMGATPTAGGTNGGVVSGDPCALPTFSASAAGIAVSAMRTTGSYTYVGWGDSFVDSGTASRARSGYKIVTGAETTSPSIDFSASQAGDAVTGVIYTTAAGGTNILRQMLAHHG